MKHDRLSLLPEALLCHILSMLPTKEAIKSSILSKQWRHVWIYLPTINFSDICHNFNAYHRFPEFVDNFFSLGQAACLQNLSLTCYRRYCSSRLNIWINVAILRSVESLSLNFWPNGRDIELPFGLFTCQTLANLKLHNHIRLDACCDVHLPRLKSLHFFRVRSLDDDSVKKFIHGCPVLEEFEIVREVDRINTLYVKSSSLRKLRVMTLKKPDPNIFVVIDAMNLEIINLNIALPNISVRSSLSSLLDVKLHVFNAQLDATVRILGQMSKTKKLNVWLDVPCIFGYNALSTFENLTDLKLVILGGSGSFLHCILESSPNLKSLFISKRTHSSDKMECHPQFHIPKCLMLYLETIEINQYEACDHEMELVIYFLENSPVLKKISFSRCSWGPRKFHDMIFKLIPKGSNNCKIIFT